MFSFRWLRCEETGKEGRHQQRRILCWDRQVAHYWNKLIIKKLILFYYFTRPLPDTMARAISQQVITVSGEQHYNEILTRMATT